MNLPTTLRTNYYTTPQIRYQEEAMYHDYPLAFNINLRNTTKTKYILKYKVLDINTQNKNILPPIT